jgi:hypothetical protein
MTPLNPFPNQYPFNDIVQFVKRMRFEWIQPPAAGTISQSPLKVRLHRWKALGSWSEKGWLCWNWNKRSKTPRLWCREFFIWLSIFQADWCVFILSTNPGFHVHVTSWRLSPPAGLSRLWVWRTGNYSAHRLYQYLFIEVAALGSVTQEGCGRESRCPVKITFRSARGPQSFFAWTISVACLLWLHIGLSILSLFSHAHVPSYNAF